MPDKETGAGSDGSGAEQSESGDQSKAKESAGGSSSGAKQGNQGNQSSGKQSGKSADVEADDDEEEDLLDGQPFDKKRALATIRSQRANERKLARDLKAAQDAVSNFEQQNLSEIDKLKKQVNDLTRERDDALGKIKTMSLQQVVTEQAARLGAIYPEALYRHIDPSEVEYAENGTPRNVAALVKGVREQYPEMFRKADDKDKRSDSSDESGNAGKKKPSIDGNAGSTGRNGQDLSMNAIIRRAAGRGSEA